jgi:hypothetical protein
LYKGVNASLIAIDPKESRPMLGDAIAGAHDYYNSKATGHFEIVVKINLDGTVITSGAHEKKVYSETMGQKMLNGATFKDRGGDFKFSPVTIRRPIKN